MKRRIKAICLKDGKHIFYPTDEEYCKLYDDISNVMIEESYTIEEWAEKFVVIRMEECSR